MTEFNLNDFLGDPNISDNSYISESIFKKAALKHDFNIENDFTEFKQEDIDLLKDRSVLKVDGNSQLNDLDQKKILQKLINNNELQDTISLFDLNNAIFSELLFKVLRKEKIGVEALSNEQIYYYGRVLKLIPGNDSAQISLKSYLEKKHFFSKFKKPIQEFAGRKKELTILKNYVDWLPASGFLSKVEKVIRYVTDWHQKKFLLIKGIGGIGKTALISKFIDNHSIIKKSQTLPFVYIDFDLIGFSIEEPLNFLIEGLKQLEFQFPNQNEALKSIRIDISKSLNKDSSRGYHSRASNEFSREYLFDRFRKMHKNKIESIKTPVLIVFDSFEEMQYRASHYELIEFFEFIKVISDYIPRIRPIFVGRAEMSESIDEFDFYELRIEEFDKESANVILDNNGVGDKKARDRIYQQLGGNPLVLNLAANLYKKSPEFIYSKQLHKRAEIQEYLVGRILQHIHDPKARDIAVPGLLVRKVNPNVIRDILAKACGIVKNSQELSFEKAEEIFKILKKESFLMQSSNNENEFIFRQDLRIACEKMILAKYSEEAKMIHRAAIKFYKDKPEDRTEYNYHVLKLKEHSDFIEENLDIRIDLESAEMLQNSAHELSDKSQLSIKNIYGSKASLDMLETAGSESASKYYTRQMEEVLLADFRKMTSLHDEISQTSFLKTYCKYDEFLFIYATLKQRLGKFNESIELVYHKKQVRTSNDLKDIYNHSTFLFLLAENYLYLKKYEDVYKNLSIINNFLEEAQERVFLGPMAVKFMTLRLKVIYLLNISKSRLSLKTNQLLKDEFLDLADQNIGNNNFEKYIIEITQDRPKLNVKWIYLFTEIYKSKEPIFFFDSDVFENYLDDLHRKAKNNKELEYICKNELDVFLKDITLEGHFKVLIFDFAMALEVSNLNRPRKLRYQ
ncbi:hypothetical protein BD809_103352 [Aquimarina intermedia]|uniref:Nephrocystin 3-like N-terminal domain-containing protein n=2 Tax=Aquimarina intermedia TaxID=350814 RepID=A0A5S5C9J4_9FLAO|nr:hypothetical protein BD809_103352 [Aquimarina intermedia]